MMKIRYKIFFGLVSIVSFLIVISIVTFFATEKVEYFRKKSSNLQAQLISITGFCGQVRNQMLATYEVTLIRGFKVGENTLSKEIERVRIKQAEFENTMNLDHLKHAEVFELVQSYERLNAKLFEAMAFAKTGEIRKAKETLILAREKYFTDDFIKQINLILENKYNENQLISENLQESISSLKNTLLIFAIFASAVALIYSILFSRSIGSRFAELEFATSKVSEGEFNFLLVESGRDEISLLSKAFNKMAQSMLKAKEQLHVQQQLLIGSSKMSALGEMASGIAHEINTPLAIIRIKTEHMEDRIANKDIELYEFQGSLDIIKRTVDRIAAIVMGLKFFARDGHDIPPQKINIYTLVDETLIFCKERFLSNGVKLEMNRDESLKELEIECRVIEISQALLNLLNNAFDAVHQLSERWIKIAVIDDGDYIKMTVQDSGRGIQVELRDKIMQPFFTTKEIGKGTGLGLSITKGIIERHRGELILDESIHRTQFNIRLPKQIRA